MNARLAAACERLDSFSDQFKRGALIDERSGLTRDDLDLILRRLARTRNVGMIPVYDMATMTPEQIDDLARNGPVPTE